MPKFDVLRQPISITAIGSVSALGDQPNVIWDNYLSGKHFIKEELIGDQIAQVACFSPSVKEEINKLKQENKNYAALDHSVLYAIQASRKAIQQAGWSAQANFGVNIGSSRGATTLFETNHKTFLSRNKANTLSSPTTTLGNISSWVAHDLNTQGPEISHSITCSSAFHALLNGIAWLQSGMCDTFLVGGSEAPLTAFTIAQMKALKIYSNTKDEFPCRASDVSKSKNTMILGEGAAVACLEKGIKPNAKAVIKGVGYATEILEHNASLSADAKCFQRSMSMALNSTPKNKVDVIITHTPGTIKGDLAELNAIKKVFGQHRPVITNNKWVLGHTLGASALLSLEFALMMLSHQRFIPLPFQDQTAPKQLNTILINAVGFGGNAVSVVISK